MPFVQWLVAHWPRILDGAGIVGGIVAVAGFFRDARARRAETTIEITKQHREIWRHFESEPELGALLDPLRDMSRTPLTEKERRFANSLFLHLRAAFYASKAGIYVQPEGLAADIKSFFARPAVRSAWDAVKSYHDRKFRAFVERSLRAVR